jgi:hypothetical protein
MIFISNAKSPVQISAAALIVLTEGFRGFSQSLQTNMPALNLNTPRPLPA